MLFAILRIFPRRSFGLTFFGVEDNIRFFWVDVEVGFEGNEDPGVDAVVVNSFFRLGVDVNESR